MVAQRALVVGNSDGIGLATTRALLGEGWDVVGISRSASPIAETNYTHHQVDVQDESYGSVLATIASEGLDLCIYCVGIGALLVADDMSAEPRIFRVNLMGLVKTTETVLPTMVKAGNGHFIGLSSIADELISERSPSYSASKAGFTSYLQGLALALQPKGVFVSNVRFGFVDTKLVKAKKTPLMMSPERAAQHIMTAIRKRPISLTVPKRMAFMVKLMSLKTKVRVLLRSL
jgi:short-subunit dehydrogenase